MASTRAKRAAKTKRVSSNRRRSAPITPFDLPFRSNHERRSRAKAKARAIGLPYQSQVAPGALENSLDCGPTCVRMALDYLGLAPNVSIDQLSNQFDPDDTGTTAEDLVTIAQAYGAAAITHSLSAGQLPPAPAILLIRYNGFRPETVQDKAYWQASEAKPIVRHWAWWLGNATIDGQMVSVWNDPLYRGNDGKNVIHTLDELRRAFVPYGAACLAVTFPDIVEVPQMDSGQLVVEAADSGGVNFRSAPTVQDPTTIIGLMPQGHRFTVLEPIDSARVKLGGSSASNFWLRVRTQVTGTTREGFVAAWLVREIGTAAGGGVPVEPAPFPTYTWQHVINATVVAATRAGQSWMDWLDRAGFWNVFLDDLRTQPYAGPAIETWPIPAEQRASLAKLLLLSPDDLVALVIETQGQGQPPPVPAPIDRASAIIGIHGPPGVGAPPRDQWDRWIGVLKDIGARWYKQCDDGDPNRRDILGWATRLQQEGIEPIIRYYADRQFPDPLPDHYFEKMRLYASAGITWAEIGNEPNLNYEWKEHWAARVNYNDPEVIRALGDAWIGDARRAIASGVRPALYAFGPTEWKGNSHPTLSSVYFSSRLAIYLADHRRQDTIGIFRQGGWFAVHSATYEQPIDFNPFLPNGAFWDMTLRGYEIIQKCFLDTFGNDLDVRQIPIMSTEGGVFTPESDSMTNHERLRTDEEHAQRVVDMFTWLATHSPLQAMCPWCLTAQGMGGPFDPRFSSDGWYKDVGGALQPRPVIDKLKQLRATLVRAAPRSRSARPGPRDLADRLHEIGIFSWPTPRRGRPKRKQNSPKGSAKPGRAKARGS
jgi:hypothetical protein